MFIIATIVLTAVTSGAQLEDGIRCQHKNGRVHVTKSQWEKVRAAFFSHEASKIAPFISQKGIIESSMTYDGYPQQKLSVTSRLISKNTFLERVAGTTINDAEYSFTANPSPVFAWFWISLAPIAENLKRKPAEVEHTRSDVWISKSYASEGRLRFVCEKGWLKVAEIKSTTSSDGY